MVQSRRLERARGREPTPEEMGTEIAAFGKFYEDVGVVLSNAGYEWRLPRVSIPVTLPGTYTNIGNPVLSARRRISGEVVINLVRAAMSQKNEEIREEILGHAQRSVNDNLGYLAVSGLEMKGITPRQFYDNLEFFFKGLEDSPVVVRSKLRIM